MQHGDELTDAKSKKKLTYKDIEPPPDWEWKDEWHIDNQLAVDDNSTVIIIYHSQFSTIQVGSTVLGQE